MGWSEARIVLESVRVRLFSIIKNLIVVGVGGVATIALLLWQSGSMDYVCKKYHGLMCFKR